MTLDARAGAADERASTVLAETLDEFLHAVQHRALAMARMATGSVDEGLDLVQDAMCAFVRAYRDKPADQRRPLFFRCLNNRILDWHRKRQRRGRWVLPWTGEGHQVSDGPDPDARAPESARPEQRLAQDDFGAALENALAALPLRQRQVFLLRAWEGLDVAETATALNISAGSVKTHYFRALNSLRGALEGFDE